MPGLFIRNQAEMMLEFGEVAVIYVHEDYKAKTKYEVVESLENGLKVIRIYYQPTASSNPMFQFVVKAYRFFKAHQIGFALLGEFHPDLIHVHVLTRHGVIALIQRWIHGIPYLITEHWSRYYSENGTYQGTVRKWVTKRVVRKASAVILVSEKLKKAFCKLDLRNPNMKVIGNPVDMTRFRMLDKGQRVTDQVEMVHISCFEDKSKNITGCLDAIAHLVQKGVPILCKFVGEGPDWNACVDYATSLGLTKNHIEFTGLLEGDALVRAINQADFMVLTSNYETFGTIIIEALACGVPVLATDVGVAAEVIDHQNGIVVPPHDPGALESGIQSMIQRLPHIDRAYIWSTVVNTYSNEAIRTKLMEVYHLAVKR